MTKQERKEEHDLIVSAIGMAQLGLIECQMKEMYKQHSGRTTLSGKTDYCPECKHRSKCKRPDAVKWLYGKLKETESK